MKIAIRSVPDGTGYVGVIQDETLGAEFNLVITGESVVDCLEKLTKVMNEK